MQQDREKKDFPMMSEINVTPLVDVILVLLIIFMVTAPMLQQGIDVDLPKAEMETIPDTEERLVVTVKKDREVFINQYKVKEEELPLRLHQLLQRRSNKDVFLRADESLPYGHVMKIMAHIRKAGVEKLGMITEPPEESR